MANPIVLPRSNLIASAAKSRRRQIRYHLTALLFISPWVMGFVIFLAYPILESLRLSFTNFQLLDSGTEYIGLRNYIFMFTKDRTLIRAMQNTVGYALMAVPLSLIIALSSAVLLNQKVRGQSLWRTLFFLPSLVPPVATVVVFRALFDPGRGLINQVLANLGLPQPGWFATSDTALITMVIMGAWGFGGAMIILLAGLQDIPRTLLEAAEIDGANSSQRFWSITLPILSPIIFFNWVLGSIGALQVFAQSLLLGGNVGWPAGSTLFYNVYVYVVGFNSPYRMGYASALGWVLFIGILLATGLNFLLARRFVFYSGE